MQSLKARLCAELRLYKGPCCVSFAPICHHRGLCDHAAAFPRTAGNMTIFPGSRPPQAVCVCVLVIKSNKQYKLASKAWRRAGRCRRSQPAQVLLRLHLLVLTVRTSATMLLLHTCTWALCPRIQSNSSWTSFHLG